MYLDNQYLVSDVVCVGGGKRMITDGVTHSNKSINQNNKNAILNDGEKYLKNGMEEEEDEEEVVFEVEMTKEERTVHTIREAASRFIQLLESIDYNLYVQCVQHSNLVIFLVQNISSYSNTATNKNRSRNSNRNENMNRNMSRNGNKYDYSTSLNDGEKMDRKSELKSELKFGFREELDSISAHSDLLCVVMRADLRQRTLLKQSQSSSHSTTLHYTLATTHSNSHTQSPAYSNLCTLTPTASLTDNLFKQIPHAALSVLSAVTFRLQDIATHLSHTLHGRGNQDKVLPQLFSVQYSILSFHLIYSCIT